MSWDKKRIALALMLVVLVAALAVAIAACGGSDEGTSATSSSSAAATGENVKWGEMNSLTGVSAAPAKTLQMGYEEEVDYVNANGGINGGQIDSINLDDKSDMSASKLRPGRSTNPPADSTKSGATQKRRYSRISTLRATGKSCTLKRFREPRGRASSLSFFMKKLPL